MLGHLFKWKINQRLTKDTQSLDQWKKSDVQPHGLFQFLKGAEPDLKNVQFSDSIRLKFHATEWFMVFTQYSKVLSRIPWDYHGEVQNIMKT